MLFRPYAPPGVAVVSWQLILDLTNGQFVGTIPSDHNPLVSDVIFPIETQNLPSSRPAAAPAAG